MNLRAVFHSFLLGLRLALAATSSARGRKEGGRRRRCPRQLALLARPES